MGIFLILKRENIHCAHYYDHDEAENGHSGLSAEPDSFIEVSEKDEISERDYYVSCDSESEVLGNNKNEFVIDSETPENSNDNTDVIREDSTPWENETERDFD